VCCSFISPVQSLPPAAKSLKNYRYPVERMNRFAWDSQLELASHTRV
jgi:hypothetical protein